MLKRLQREKKEEEYMKKLKEIEKQIGSRSYHSMSKDEFDDIESQLINIKSTLPKNLNSQYTKVSNKLYSSNI